MLLLVQAQGRSYSAPVVAASSDAPPPFPGGSGTTKAVDCPRCDVVIVGRLPMLPSAAAAVVAVVFDGDGTSLQAHLLINSFC
jgi:hypothetical protein